MRVEKHINLVVMDSVCSRVSRPVNFHGMLQILNAPLSRFVYVSAYSCNKPPTLPKKLKASLSHESYSPNWMTKYVNTPSPTLKNAIGPPRYKLSKKNITAISRRTEAIRAHIDQHSVEANRGLAIRLMIKMGQQRPRPA